LPEPGGAALCAGMTEILHPSTGTVKFPGGAYEFLGELAAFRAGLVGGLLGGMQ
jgi:hypothetical protein